MKRWVPRDGDLFEHREFPGLCHYTLGYWESDRDPARVYLMHCGAEIPLLSAVPVELWPEGGQKGRPLAVHYECMRLHQVAMFRAWEAAEAHAREEERAMDRGDTGESQRTA